MVRRRLAGGAARAARNLTEIWLMSFRSKHNRVAYRRDLTGWSRWVTASVSGGRRPRSLAPRRVVVWGIAARGFSRAWPG